MRRYSRRRPLLLVGALAAALSAACADDQPTDPALETDEPPPTEVRAVAPPALSKVLGSPPALAICGAPVEMALTNGRHTPGTVTVSNDATNLYVTYTAQQEGWFISDTRIAVVRTLASIPKDGKFPNPWAFPHVGEHEPPQRSITHTIPLAQLGFGAGEKVVIAAWAGAVHPRTSDWSGEWEWVTLWGIGNIQGKKYETIHNYTMNACAGQPPAPAPAAGVITLTFDDGWLTTWTNAFPVLRELGLKGNVAINPEPIDGGWADYMSLAQVRELHAAGWSIVSHSVTHRDLTTLSAADLTRELVDSKAWIQRHGFGDSPVFIVPFHSWGERERAEIRKYYQAARGLTVNQFWPEAFAKYPPADPHALTGYEPEFAPFTTAEGREQTMEYVERAVRESEFLDLFFHRITAEQVPAFRQLMTEVARYQAHVRTLDQAF